MRIIGLVILLALLLSNFILPDACLSSTTSKYHVVKRGETLYRISKIYGVPVEEIKKKNHLSGNEIYPGQMLFIPGKALLTPERKGVYHEVERYQTLWRIAKTYGVPMEEIARVNNISNPTQIKVGQRLFIPGVEEVREVEVPDEKTWEALTRPSETKKVSEKRVSPKIKVKERVSPGLPVKEEVSLKMPQIDWELSWPVEGEVIKYFGEEDSLGIDVATAQGKTIFAPAEGIVYYDGWLRGYGRTLIIYHQKEELYTCYMHNSDHLVRKGDRVRKGDPIARVGSTGTVDIPCLHFEIRKGEKGKPVNPLDYLP